MASSPVLSAERVPDLERVNDYLDLWTGRDPERVFVVAGEERLTYAEVSSRVNALARHLRSVGVEPGDRMATLSTPRPEFLVAYLATLRLGAIFVGLNPKYRRAELAHVIDDSRPKIVAALTSSHGRDYDEELAALAAADSVEQVLTIGGSRDVGPSLDEVIAANLAGPDSTTPVAGAGGTPALLVYTSGTTGTPKGALLTQAGLSWCFAHQSRRWGVDPLRMICNLPINHIAAAGDAVLTPLACGGTVIFQERFDQAAILAAIAEEGVSVLFQIPTMLQLMTSADGFDSADLSSLELISWGGAALPRSVLGRLRERTGSRLEVMYGQTETTGTVTFSAADATDEQLTTTIGRPDPAIELRLAGPDGPVPAGTEGEIQVRHHSFFAGYYERPEATAEVRTPDGFLRTGDLAVERPDGYREIVGRANDMYKSGGYNVYPREIELCLERHPAVAQAAVVGVPDDVFGEVGRAFVVPLAGAGLDGGELRAWCTEQLANYKVPKLIEVLDSLPRLPIGKVDKRRLRERGGARSTQGDRDAKGEKGRAQ